MPNVPNNDLAGLIARLTRLGVPDPVDLAPFLDADYARSLSDPAFVLYAQAGVIPEIAPQMAFYNAWQPLTFYVKGATLVTPGGGSVVVDDDFTTGAVFSEAGVSRLTADGTGGGGAPDAIPATQQSGNYTLDLDDAGTIVEMTGSSSQIVTVPTIAVAGWPVGIPVEILRVGTGSVTIAAAVGVTIQCASSLVLRAQYSNCGLRHRGADIWSLVGDLV